MYINNTKDDSLILSPLSPSEIEEYVKKNMHYDTIYGKICQGRFGGNLELLNRIVHLVVDLQYIEGELKIREEILPVKDAAHQVLQLRQYQAEYVLSRLHCSHAEDIADSCLLEAIYSAIGSIGAYRYAARHKLKIT